MIRELAEHLEKEGFYNDFVSYCSGFGIAFETNARLMEETCGSDYIDLLESTMESTIDHEAILKLEEKFSEEEYNTFLKIKEEPRAASNADTIVLESILKKVSEVYWEVTGEMISVFCELTSNYYKENYVFYTDNGVPKNKPFEGVW